MNLYSYGGYEVIFLNTNDIEDNTGQLNDIDQDNTGRLNDIDQDHTGRPL